MWVVSGTLPVRTGLGVVNRMAVFSPDGAIAYETEKVHLFKQMGEDTAFFPGKCGGTFPFKGTKAAGIICYDLRFPELARRLVLDGAEILFVPAQWPAGRLELFRSLLRARAAEAQIFTVGCNLGGEHLGVMFNGGGGVAHPGGKMIKGRTVAEGVTDYDIELSDVALIRSRINCLEDRRPEEYGTLIFEGDLN
jgi:omega-amidase